VWKVEGLQAACIEHFKTHLSSLQVFSKWLMEKSSGWINIINLGIWLWERNPSTPHQIQTAPLRSSPSLSSVCTPASTTHAEWRSRLRLSEHDSETLFDRLGYVDGDDLTALSNEDWTTIPPIPPLQKKCILSAYAASKAAGN
jgi:hypothetical protein